MDEIGEQMWKSLSSVALKKFVHKKVNILLSDKSQKIGWVHVVDPVTRTVVLAEHNEETVNSLTFVLGHAILRVCVEDESSPDFLSDVSRFVGIDYANELSDEELRIKKTDLMAWLTKNRVPVTETVEDTSILSVMGVLFIEPPYSPESCRCANEIVLDRIQRLMSQERG